MEQKKEFWIAFGINFFFPGGGHIYAGYTNNGVVLLVVYLSACALTPALYFPGLVVVGIWIYALIKSKEVVEKFNNRIETKKLAEEQEEANTITSAQFISLINKANQLLAAEMISETEFQAKKQTIISELQFKKFSGDKDDLLLGLAPLKKMGTIADEELQLIKEYCQ